MAASITLLVVPADDPDAFEDLFLAERKSRSRGWVKFPVGCGRYLDTFFMKATSSDLGVVECDPHEDDETGERIESNLIDRDTLVEVLPKLRALVDKNADRTARALHTYGGGKGAVSRVATTLKSGNWPKDRDAAREAAAFAHHLLKSAERAVTHEMGICWEYRGELMI
jgi:hypothetical protein